MSLDLLSRVPDTHRLRHNQIATSRFAYVIQDDTALCIGWFFERFVQKLHVSPWRVVDAVSECYGVFQDELAIALVDSHGAASHTEVCVLGPGGEGINRIVRAGGIEYTPHLASPSSHNYVTSLRGFLVGFGEFALPNVCSNDLGFLHEVLAANAEFFSALQRASGFTIRAGDIDLSIVSFADETYFVPPDLPIIELIDYLFVNAGRLTSCR